jgi:hypothetical protein
MSFRCISKGVLLIAALMRMARSDRLCGRSKHSSAGDETAVVHTALDTEPGKPAARGVGRRGLAGAVSIYATDPDYQEAEMAYERLDEALRQLKTDREPEEADRKTTKKGERRSQDAVRTN